MNQKPNSKKIMMDIAAPVIKKDLEQDSKQQPKQDLKRNNDGVNLHIDYSKAETKKEEKKIDEKKFGDAATMGRIDFFDVKEGKEVKEEKIKELIIGKPKEPKKPKKILYWILSVAIVGFLFYAALFILPKADIKIVAKKYPWNFNDTIAAVKGLTDINPVSRQIPAEFFSQTKNIVENQPATGKGYVEKYATGEIIVYNNFSSNPQLLVRGTRFEAPNGKIFKLTKSAVIPGLSSLRVQVQAEKPGLEYNIPPVSKFTIPGFKNSSKYSSFYGQSNSPMAGGFVGNRAYPTNDDVNNIKKKAEADLRSALQLLINSQISQEYKVLDNTQHFNITKETIGDVDEKGNFSITVEGGMLAAAFKEEDVLRLMNILAGQSFQFQGQSHGQISYGNGQFNGDNSQFSFSINYQGTYWQPIDVEKFKNSILGKDNIELKTFIFSMPNIEKTNISFWPFWVSSVPTNVKRINVEVE